MATKIRLKRFGKIRTPHYRVVVMDSRTKRDGRAIEEIGQYHPKSDPSEITVDSERVQYWLGVGAQPSDQVAAILKVTGEWAKFKGEEGTEGTLKAKEAKVSAEERIAAADKAAAEKREEVKATKAKAEAEAAAEKEAAEAAENAESSEESAEGAEAETSEETTEEA